MWQPLVSHCASDFYQIDPQNSRFLIPVGPVHVSWAAMNFGTVSYQRSRSPFLAGVVQNTRTNRPTVITGLNSPCAHVKGPGLAVAWARATNAIRQRGKGKSHVFDSLSSRSQVDTNKNLYLAT